MAQYIVLITSIVGRKGDTVELPDNSQTTERLKRGIVAGIPKPIETFEPAEKKVTKPTSWKAKK
jgi:hypothetical protein